MTKGIPQSVVMIGSSQRACKKELCTLPLFEGGNGGGKHRGTKSADSQCSVAAKTSSSMEKGDLANVRVGRHCVVKSRSVIRPPFKKFSKGVAFFPLHIGDHVFIEEDCVINAAQIGSYVHIGKNCVIGRRCVLKDCWLFSGELPECTQELMIDVTKSYYQKFLPLSQI
ncbi:hypothetical protein DNTS_004518 [Danionella cerebrum]|uniref:Dynactin subunit 5 n=1 Tax=Danionella cerebrum TaxID=2873325 RepID=A0A553QM07_9TELE|nr:hypothetical protein DNTS_004518 [Danionella translucida]